MREGKQGTTLLEVLVVTGLLGLFLGMIGEAVVMAYRAHVKTTEKMTNYRMAAIAVARLNRELATSSSWVTPVIGTIPPIDIIANSTTPATPPLNFFRNSATGPVEVNYYLYLDPNPNDPHNGELRRVDPLSPAGYKVVARGIRLFQVSTSPNASGLAVPVNVNVTVMVNEMGNDTNITLTASTLRS